MAIEMNEINLHVKAALEKSGLPYTIDNRVECLAAFAKEIVEWDEVEPLERTSTALNIAVEIVRLRIEKQMFGE